MRDGYEYLRNWGIARIGLFGEMCAVSDMTYLAIKLSDYGVGDYWEDVDCYVRNVLADRQITSADKLRKAVGTEPIDARDQLDNLELFDFMVEAPDSGLVEFKSAPLCGVSLGQGLDDGFDLSARGDTLLLELPEGLVRRSASFVGLLKDAEFSAQCGRGRCRVSFPGATARGRGGGRG